MTPLDYDFLRKCLKQQSGLALSADKHYLVESRLLSLARNAGLTLAEFVRILKTGRDAGLMASVVEAMTTNESFFFRDKLHLSISAAQSSQHYSLRGANPV